MAMTQDQRHMRAALDEAESAFKRGEVPIGAVLVEDKSGEIAARAGNNTLEMSDPSAHAEILCIRHACAQAGVQRIPGHTLYVTLEPCPMCAAALAYARIGRVVFGAHDTKSGGLVSGPNFADSQVIHHHFEIASGVCADESSTLLKNFFQARR